MYICELCEKVQPRREPCNFTTIQRREKTYQTYNPKTKKTKHSKGWEIVKEIKLCYSCSEKVKANDQETNAGSKDQ